ncbi:hypothetical protein [Streptomyces sp. MMS24-I29]|uniref:AAA family ATPase n=1 Tax=Streptomyces sp. MMS24-I29 TaxID=3351480 RepID=UPI003C7D7400
MATNYDVFSALIKSTRSSAPTWAALAGPVDRGGPPADRARERRRRYGRSLGAWHRRGSSEGVQLIGVPEAQINLVRATVVIATAPKSPLSTAASNQALDDVRRRRTGEVPVHLRDAHHRELGPSATARARRRHPAVPTCPSAWHSVLTSRLSTASNRPSTNG